MIIKLAEGVTVEVEGDGDETNHGPRRSFPSNPTGRTYYVYVPSGVLFKARIRNRTDQPIDVYVGTVTGELTAVWPPVPCKITVAANSEVLVPTGILGPPSDVSGRYWWFWMEGRDPVTVEIVKHETESDDSGVENGDDSGMEEDNSGTDSPIVWFPQLMRISAEVRVDGKAVPFVKDVQVGQDGMLWGYEIPPGKNVTVHLRLHGGGGDNDVVDVKCLYLIEVNNDPTSKSGRRSRSVRTSRVSSRVLCSRNSS